MTKHLLLFRILLFTIIAAILLLSCKTLTPEQAASGSYKKARSVL